MLVGGSGSSIARNGLEGLAGGERQFCLKRHFQLFET
jgi:hypothetical protein